MRIDVLTLFPAIIETVMQESIPKIAQEKGIAEIYCHNIRDWARNKHRKVDDRPFGGGPGMVMACQPLCDSIEAVRNMTDNAGRLLFLTPEGRTFTQSIAREFAEEQRLIFVCGRYEGFDERVFDILQPERLSVGDFILSGGEIAAMTVMDAVIRLLPGVLGCGESAACESFAGNTLDWPQYTQPWEYRGLYVPEVLRGGNHAEINRWRKEAAERRMRIWRPDLVIDKKK